MGAAGAEPRGVAFERLAADGVEILPDRGDEANGRFAWIVDCEGNRIELWEPAPG